jgi:hypothetical protein
MPLNVPPSAGLYPPAPDITEELRLMREQTHWFIMADPIELALIPLVETQVVAGGIRLQDGQPIENQIFRLIPMSSAERPFRGQNESGQQRRYEFTLLGEWDALLEANYRWENTAGQSWIVTTMVPFNGYEKKGLVTSYGRRP